MTLDLDDVVNKDLYGLTHTWEEFEIGVGELIHRSHG